MKVHRQGALVRRCRAYCTKDFAIEEGADDLVSKTGTPRRSSTPTASAHRHGRRRQVLPGGSARREGRPAPPRRQPVPRRLRAEGSHRQVMDLVNVKDPQPAKATYEVDMSYGGGLYKQRWLTRLADGSRYVLPVQYNSEGQVKTRKYRNGNFLMSCGGCHDPHGYSGLARCPSRTPAAAATAAIPGRRNPAPPAAVHVETTPSLRRRAALLGACSIERADPDRIRRPGLRSSSTHESATSGTGAGHPPRSRQRIPQSEDRRDGLVRALEAAAVAAPGGDRGRR